MPFVGLQKSTQQRINILDIEGDPRTAIDKNDLVCPLCGQQLTVVAGAIVMKHFRHTVKCSSEIDRHPESIRHLAGKWHVRNYCRRLYGDDVKIDFEVAVSEANRQADVMVIWPSGFREAHEIQLASITTEYLNKRTADYRRAEIDVVWWLGGSADTPANRNWCIDTYGDVRIITFSTLEYRD